MSKKARVFLLLSGLFIFFSWGFRLYILTLRWGTSPLRIVTIFFALVFLWIGLFLVRTGLLADKATYRTYTQLCYAALWIAGFWAYRLMNLVRYPDMDPNPRAHIHLSVTFIVMGIFLFAMGRKGRTGETDRLHSVK